MVCGSVQERLVPVMCGPFNQTTLFGQVPQCKPTQNPLLPAALDCMQPDAGARLRVAYAC